MFRTGGGHLTRRSRTNWCAEAEHGGFYLTVANRIYKKHGIDADIRMGGPQQNPSTLLSGGRVDMIMSNSFEAINYVNENIPFLSSSPPPAPPPTRSRM